MTPDDPDRCPACHRRASLNSDGTRRAHRTLDNPAAPYCPEGGDPRRNYSGRHA